jgi:uncharacterized protein YcbK (DUF882 family)
MQVSVLYFRRFSPRFSAFFVCAGVLLMSSCTSSTGPIESPVDDQIQSFDSSGRAQIPGNETAAASSTYSPAHLNSDIVESPEQVGQVNASEESDISQIAGAFPTPAPRSDVRNAPHEAGIEVAFSDPSPAPTGAQPDDFPAGSVPGRDPSPETVSVLPGVRTGNTLFDINIENGDAEEDASPIDIAAVAGFARLSPTGLTTQRPEVEVSCLKPALVKLLKEVERHYGKPAIVTSGYRSVPRNRRAGGARQSMHITCAAADIQIDGVSKWALAKYLRTVPGRGGIGTYCRTRSVHIDIGEVRDWHHPCKRSKERSADLSERVGSESHDK